MASKSKKTYTWDQVREHSSFDDCWLVIEGRVYDVTRFIDEHPGGDVIVDGAGTDATELFEDIGHSEIARDMLEEYMIGMVAN